MTEEDPDLSKVDEIVSRFNGDRGALIPVLQEVQKHYGYIPEGAVCRIADGLKIFPSSIYGVMTFYTQLTLEPKGKNIITVCSGTACHVKGSDRIISRVRDDLNLAEGEDTTDDREFTVEKVACIGACSIAPVVVVGKQVFGKMNPDKTMRNLKKFTEAAE